MGRSVLLLHMVAIAFSFPVTASAQQVESVSETMQFEQCLELIRRTASKLGVAPKNIVETQDVRMVRFNTVEGSVLVTCSRLDQKMVITISPYRGN